MKYYFKNKFIKDLKKSILIDFLIVMVYFFILRKFFPLRKTNILLILTLFITFSIIDGLLKYFKGDRNHGNKRSF